MTREEAIQAFVTGIEAVRELYGQGYRMIITGEISDVMSAMTEVVDYFRDTLGYVVCNITKR